MRGKDAAINVIRNKKLDQAITEIAISEVHRMYKQGYGNDDSVDLKDSFLFSRTRQGGDFWNMILGANNRNGFDNR